MARWQPATEDLFQAARRTETLAAAMFGGAPSPVAETQLPMEMLGGLGELHACSQAYDRLVSQAAGETIK
jgi:hypothetical protein